MNKIIAVIAIVFAFTLGTVFSADIATAVKPVTEVFVTNDATNPIPITGSISSNPACPAENVQHWAVLTIQTTASLVHSSLPDIQPNRLAHITVQINPDEVLDNKKMILEKLVSLGYTASGGGPLNEGNFTEIFLLSYSTICATP